MRRHPSSRRFDWQNTNSSLGLIYDEDASYWCEDAYYSFSQKEIAELEEAASAIYSMCISAGDFIISSCSRVDCGAECFMLRSGIPQWAHSQIIRTWFDGDAEAWAHPGQTPDYSPAIYGRFDIRYDGNSPPKLLEFNAQTPTSLVEGSVIQWQWLEEKCNYDQWNSLHEKLIAAWQRNMAALFQSRPWLSKKTTIYFAYDTSEESGEDYMNTAYMQETARAAGFKTEMISMVDIGLDQGSGKFFFNGKQIEVIFALYPWEWLWHEEGGKPVFLDMADPLKEGTVWIEPPYKAAIWGNKALLPVLWQMFGNDPILGKYLLPAYFVGEQPTDMYSYARKPIWGREGKNTVLFKNGEEVEATSGEYGREGYILQELCPLPDFEGIEGIRHPVLGVWMVDGEPAGMGIRESSGLITDNTSQFVPHVII